MVFKITSAWKGKTGITVSIEVECTECGSKELEIETTEDNFVVLKCKECNYCMFPSVFA